MFSQGLRGKQFTKKMPQRVSLRAGAKKLIRSVRVLIVSRLEISVLSARDETWAVLGYMRQFFVAYDASLRIVAV